MTAHTYMQINRETYIAPFGSGSLLFFYILSLVRVSVQCWWCHKRNVSNPIFSRREKKVKLKSGLFFFLSFPVFLLNPVMLLCTHNTTQHTGTDALCVCNEFYYFRQSECETLKVCEVLLFFDWLNMSHFSIYSCRNYIFQMNNNRLCC